MPMRKVLEELRIIRIRANGLARRREAEKIEQDEEREYAEAYAREQAAIDGIRERAMRG